MRDEPKSKTDFRLPTASKWSAPRAVADAGGGTIIATAEVAAPPERVFRALTSADELERWWRHPDYYDTKDWTVDLRVCGPWSATVCFPDGSTNPGSGEFAEIEAPRKFVMTRKFENHPLQGRRETTITYRLDPVANGTRVTVRDEGFVGRSEAAFGNAEHWERVLGWLAAYFNQDTQGDNKNMTGKDYSASITANITAQEATERINRVADWWTASFTGASGKIGDAFTVRFGETLVDFAVVEFVPARRILWRVTDCNLQFVEDKKEWKDTRVVFDISSDGAATTVTMTHAGLVPGVECYEVCRKGWNFCITESLQKLLRENQGIPDGSGRRESAEKAGADTR